MQRTIKVFEAPKNLTIAWLNGSSAKENDLLLNWQPVNNSILYLVQSRMLDDDDSLPPAYNEQFIPEKNLASFSDIFSFLDLCHCYRCLMMNLMK